MNEWLVITARSLNFDFGYTWPQVSLKMEQKYHEYRTADAWRLMVKRLNEREEREEREGGKGDKSNKREEIVEDKESNKTKEEVETKDISSSLYNKDNVLLSHGYDPKEFTLKQASSSEKNTASGILRSSRIVVAPRRGLDVSDVIDAISRIEARARPIPAPCGAYRKRMLELTLADLHLNKLAWHGTTGNDYDLNIACTRVYALMDDLMDRIRGERFDRIIIPLGNDLFNSDGSDGATHAGTVQDEDTRFPKVIEKATQLFVDIIEMLRPHSNDTLVTLVPGNHDQDSSMMFSHIMKAWFRNCTDVTVDTTPRKRKYYEFGKCMLALGHFADEKKRVWSAIPAEAPGIWGRTKYREAHGSHFHTESVLDFNGFTMRRASSITATDEWHYDNAYGSPQRHATYVWDSERGLDTVWYYNV